MLSIINELKMLTDSGTPAQVDTESSYCVKRKADQMLRKNCARSLHELLCLQVTKCEILQSENDNLNKEVRRYELCLAEVDTSFKTSKSTNEVIQNLKKTIEKQLK